MRSRTLDVAHPPQRISDRTAATWVAAAVLAIGAYLLVGIPGIVVFALSVAAAAVAGGWAGRENADWYVGQAQSVIRMLDAELDAEDVRRQAEREALERRAINALLADLRDERTPVVGVPTVTPRNGGENAPQIASSSADGETVE